MNVTIPDELKPFVEQRVISGHYPNPNAYVEELVRTEAEIFERAGRGEPLPIDEHLDRRLETLLDEAESSDDYVDVTEDDFDAMEREAQELVRDRKSS